MAFLSFTNVWFRPCSTLSKNRNTCPSQFQFLTRLGSISQIPIVCNGAQQQPQREPHWTDEDTDYFGRDPRKETEFWMEHAREVLESKEVVEAVEQHKQSGKTNLTPEQEAWLEFAKSISPEDNKE
eukprot:jgi/Galph1/4473/GphlegSOOS_G3159.1